MKALILALVGCAALASFPAHADHRHHWGGHPFVSFGYAYGYPRYHHHHHWHYPPYLFGLRFNVGPRYRVYRTRAEATVSTVPARLFVYPAAGQSEEQTSQDRYECHVWAADESGFDPTLGGGTAEQMDGYNRAFIACMEGRDYVVK